MLSQLVAREQTVRAYHICVKLISRPIKAEDKGACARIMRGWYNSVVAGPRSHRRERVLAPRSRYRCLYLGPNRTAKHANEGDLEGHANVQRREEELTGGLGRAGACYKAKRGAFDYSQGIAYARRH